MANRHGFRLEQEKLINKTVKAMRTTDLPPKLQQLVRAAQEAREAAYAPYSRFRVGAAARTRSGKMYIGCNVENASFGLSVCAERVAVFNAIAAGDRNILELAVCAESDQPTRPCGACRQVLFEFAPNAKIIMVGLTGAIAASDISALFPEPFHFVASPDSGAR
jgi:cytidine deaminase